MNIFLETLQKIEESVFAKKRKKELISLLLQKYTNQQHIVFDIRDKKIVLKVHPLIKQSILIKKQFIIEDCQKEGIDITSIV